MAEDREAHPKILSFAPTQDCVEPGTVMTWRWSVYPLDATSRITVTDGPRKLACLKCPTPSGEFRWLVPESLRSPRELSARIDVETQSGKSTQSHTFWVDVVPILHVLKLEITQAIQTLDRIDGTPDNSLPLVAHKDTIVRVYIECDRGGFNNDVLVDVTGTLTFDDVVLSPINGQDPVWCGGWTGGDLFIDVGPSGSIDRANIDHTLNFRIPAGMATPGFHDLDVRVASEDVCGEAIGDRYFKIQKWLDPTPLTIHVLRITDDHATGTHTTPSIEDAVCTVWHALDLIPSQPSHIEWSPLTDIRSTKRDLKKGTGMRGLLEDLHDDRSCSLWESFVDFLPFVGNDCDPIYPKKGDVLLAIAETASGISKTGSSFPTAVASIYKSEGAVSRDSNKSLIPDSARGIVASHELGHLLGLDHVPLATCNMFQPPSNATYMPEDGGYLWDVPFDTYFNWTANLGTVPMSGGRNPDFMSYGCDLWVSAESWRRMLHFFGISSLAGPP